jgi:hypothetical protein
MNTYSNEIELIEAYIKTGDIEDIIPKILCELLDAEIRWGTYEWWDNLPTQLQDDWRALPIAVKVHIYVLANDILRLYDLAEYKWLKDKRIGGVICIMYLLIAKKEIYTA